MHRLDHGRRPKRLTRWWAGVNSLPHIAMASTARFPAILLTFFTVGTMTCLHVEVASAVGIAVSGVSL
jgi:hypothetical protein